MNFVYCRQKSPVCRVITYTEKTADMVVNAMWERDYTVHQKNNQLCVSALGDTRPVYIDLNEVIVFSEKGFTRMTLDAFNQNYEPCNPDGHTYGGVYEHRD